MNKKYVVMLSTLILLLTITGITYAEWTDQIVAIGKINTAVWHLCPSVETQVWFDDGVDYTINIPGRGEIEKELVFPWGYVYAWECTNAFELEFENVYPCLTAHFKVDIHNDGEVPAAFHGIKNVYALMGEAPPVLGLNKYFPPGVVYDYDHPYFTNPATPKYYYDLLYDPMYKQTITYPAANTIQIEVDLVNEPVHYFPSDKAHVALITIVLSAETRDPNDPIDPREQGDQEYAPPNSWVQIDPGYEVYADVSIHFGEFLEQSTIYKFGWEMDFINWNELGNVAPPGPLMKMWGVD